MDRVGQYKQTTNMLVYKLAEMYGTNSDELDSIVVADDKNGQYMLFVGWRGHERIE